MSPKQTLLLSLGLCCHITVENFDGIYLHLHDSIKPKKSNTDRDQRFLYFPTKEEYFLCDKTAKLTRLEKNPIFLKRTQNEARIGQETKKFTHILERF